MAKADKKPNGDQQGDQQGDSNQDAVDFPRGVVCDQCNKPVDSVDSVTNAKVYVTCHNARQGVPLRDSKSGPVHAFKGA